MQPGLGKRVAFLTVPLMLSACGGGGGGTVATSSPTTLPTTAFTSWSTDLANKAIKADGRGTQVSGDFASPVEIFPPEDATASALFIFDSNGKLSALELTSTTATSTKTEGFGSISAFAPDFDPGTKLLFAQDTNLLKAGSGTSLAFISDPVSGAWNYQSFGVWETGRGTDSRTFYAMSVGAPTAGTAIPGSSTANSTFTGTVVGTYVNQAGDGHTALANLNVVVDWGNQSLTLSTSGTEISADGATFTPSPGLDMTDTLTYQAGTNVFTSTSNTSLTTSSGLSGASSGQFYGPNAEELGGVFSLSDLNSPTSPETYAGAYGAAQ